ncbi:hypothetical protein F2Q68_00021691 [Brassica cretica]|uniref:Uncharacterized protein n=1 Tax=Brassica cretica TaxID=69181 RepID=A0A8S9G1W5_BRACR|nr:hypothetical protein F2Q68_00021691 [Brassica cretica]
MLLALGKVLAFWQSSAREEFSQRICFFFWSHGKFVAEVPGVVFEVEKAPEVYSDSEVPREPGYAGGDGNSALF